MHREGHLGIAFLGYSPIVYLLVASGDTQTATLGLVGIGFGSTLPDIDLNVSFLEHRGLTHSAVGAGVTGVMYAVAGVFLVSRGLLGDDPTIVGYLLASGFAFGIGAYAVFLHLAGDVLTPMGIRPLQPFDDRKYTLNVVRAANERANRILFHLGAVALVSGFVFGVLGLSYVIDRIIKPVLGAL